MKIEYAPPRDKFGPVETHDDKRAMFTGGGTLRTADLGGEIFEPGWEPMPVPVWEVLVNAVLTRVPSDRYSEVIAGRLAQVETDPDWNRHWICHPDAFEGLLSRPEFCAPNGSSTESKRLWVSGREIVKRGTLTRRECNEVVRSDREGERLAKWLREARLITDAHDDPSKHGLLFRVASDSEWRQVLDKETYFVRRSLRPRQTRRSAERPAPT